MLATIARHLIYAICFIYFTYSPAQLTDPMAWPLFQMLLLRDLETNLYLINTRIRNDKCQKWCVVSSYV